MRLSNLWNVWKASLVFVALASAALTSDASPIQGGKAPQVFLRVGNGQWQKAPVQCRDGRLVFTLDPATLHSGEMMLLIDPPPGMVMNDNAGPQVIAVEVAGKSTPVSGRIDLGNVQQPPDAVRVTFREQANALAADGYRLVIDGRVAPARALRLTRQGAKQATMCARLSDSDYGSHEIRLTATDTSPQSNETTVALRYNYLETGNVALSALGAKVAVDSSFAGYESLAALNDGLTTMPGDHCGNDISWASAEVAADHWAQITLARPATIKEATIYWAAFSNVSHTPRHFQVQVPEGAGWKTVYASPAEGEQAGPLTTAHFAPVTTNCFRVFMPRGEGPSNRPNLLWIGEIKAR